MHRRAHVSAGDSWRQSSLTLHLLTLALAVMASAILLVTEADGGRRPWRIVIEVLITAGVTTGLALLVRKKSIDLPDPPFILPLLVMVVVASIIQEPLQRWFLATGRPFEMMIMYSQKNLMLALGICGIRAGCQRLCVIIGVFLTIFCAVISGDRTVHWLIAAFGVMAIAWLVESYWDTLRERLLHTDERRIPRGWLATAMAIPLLLLLVSSSAGSSLISAVEGFLPGSGGTGESDPFARSGVNDGDALVAGTNNIRSFGPIEDAPFAEDDKPSLYDVVNYKFEEAARKIGRQDRSVALPAEMLAEVRQKLARSQQAARQFSTLRREAKRDPRQIRNLDSHAMFYVAGRVPLHLRMELYDVFDGIDWYPEEPVEGLNGMAMVTLKKRPWLRVPCSSRAFDLFAHSETHAIKVVNLRTNVIPCPPDTRGVHIDRVDQPEMYGAYKQGLVKMNRDALPELTPIQILSERIDFSRLDQEAPGWFRIAPEQSRMELPAGWHMRAVRDLAEKWTAGIPRGWKQIEAVRRALQENYQLDPQARPADDCEFPVGHFLLRSKRGPEYLFASSAAVMLRSLGYTTRLVSGFYVRPEKYDAARRHTPVHAGDTHFWCEVSPGGGTWLTVEAAPGFEVLGPLPGFWQRVWQGVQQVLRVVRRHWLAASCGVAALVAAFARRRVLADAVRTVWWTLRPAGSVRARVLQTMHLLDCRLRYAGEPRERGVTLRRWLRTRPSVAAVSPALRDFAELADWAAFSRSGDTPSEPPVAERGRAVPSAGTIPATSISPEECCRCIRQEVTLQKCRRVLAEARQQRNRSLS